jgi:hypothetical protein
VVPVWMLERTRVPTGTELWRIARSGEQQLLSSYGGPALGWRGATGYYPPIHLVGPRAVWQGVEYPADFTPDLKDVELVHVGQEPPAGFEAVRPQIPRRFVPVDECDRVFDLVLNAMARCARGDPAAGRRPGAVVAAQRRPRGCSATRSGGGRAGGLRGARASGRADRHLRQDTRAGGSVSGEQESQARTAAPRGWLGSSRGGRRGVLRRGSAGRSVMTIRTSSSGGGSSGCLTVRQVSDEARWRCWSTSGGRGYGRLVVMTGAAAMANVGVDSRRSHCQTDGCRK